MFRSSSSPRRLVFQPAVIQPLEDRRMMSMTAQIVEVPISSAAKAADPNLNNYKTLDLKVTVTSGDDWISGELNVSLTSGNFYIPSSGNSKTAQPDNWQSSPNLEFDTFVSAPNFQTPTLLGSNTFSSTVVNVAWGDTDNTGPGTFTVARLTVTKTAVGNISGDVFSTSAPTTPVPFASSVQSQTGTITGTVFKDLNGDGVKNSNDTGLSGWRIFIDKDGDKRYDSNETYVRSNSSGVYTFSNILNGTYRICETLVDSSWRYTVPANGVYTVVLTGGSTSTKLWGNTQNPQVSGSVFNDANGNKLRDSGEAGLAGWRIFVDSDNDNVWDSSESSVLSDSSGNWVINSLKANKTYNIRIVQQSGWKRTTQSTFTVKLASAQLAGGKLFGEKQV
jgi:hypothetical protein